MANTLITLPPYLPDQSANSGVLLEANNVYPRVDGYGPVKDWVSLSSALPSAFRGAGSFIAKDGNSYLLAGTATGLSRFTAGAWTDLVTGMTVPGRWRFTQFGDYVVGVNNVLTKVVNLNTGVATTLAGAPAGVTIGVVGDYVVILQGIGELLNVYTSAFNDHTGWTPAVNGSTIQPMLVGGECMGFGGGEYGVILQKQRIVRMGRTGDARAPFQYDEITSNVGCASRSSVIQGGRSVFFLSDQGFMALEDGQAVKPIGSEEIDRTFQAEVLREDYEQIFAAYDPQNKLVIWMAPGGKLWIYNIPLGRWSTSTPAVEGIFSGFTSSATTDSLDATYPNIDASSISVDDASFAGGSPKLYGVKTGAIGTFTGANLKASFQMGFGEYSKGRTSRFASVRPVTDCVAGNAIYADVRARMGDAANVKTAGALRASGIMPIRATGRYTKLRWEIAAGSTWAYAQGLELELEAGGGR